MPAGRTGLTLPSRWTAIKSLRPWKGRDVRTGPTTGWPGRRRGSSPGFPCADAAGRDREMLNGCRGTDRRRWDFLSRALSLRCCRGPQRAETIGRWERVSHAWNGFCGSGSRHHGECGFGSGPGARIPVLRAIARDRHSGRLFLRYLCPVPRQRVRAVRRLRSQSLVRVLQPGAAAFSAAPRLPGRLIGLAGRRPEGRPAWPIFTPRFAGNAALAGIGLRPLMDFALDFSDCDGSPHPAE